MIKPGSAWTMTAGVPSYSALVGERTTDVVVVGAGIVGLTTALLLQQQGHRVTVVEGRRIGAGTTGHTTGKVTAQHGLRYVELLNRTGEARARRYADANAKGVEQVAALVNDYGIDCDLTRAPALVYTRHSHRRPKLAREAETTRLLGLPADLVDDTSLPFDVAAAVRMPDQLQLHPVRYLAGLASAVAAGGGDIVEGSPVTTLDRDDGGVRAVTPEGSVLARWAVLATLLPIGTVGGLFARTTPSHSHGLAVRLRSAAPAEMTISAESPKRSTRPWDPDDPETMIVVGHGHQTGTGSPSRARADLERWTREMFDVVSVDHQWSAHDHMPIDGLPFVGPTPLADNVLAATGFAKWGLSTGTAAATLLTDIIAGQENPWGPDVAPSRIGGIRDVASTAWHNAQIGAQFVGGHLRSRSNPTCTHLCCRLSWNDADSSWDCACHGSRFDVDGSVLAAPAVTPLHDPPPPPA